MYPARQAPGRSDSEKVRLVGIGAGVRAKQWSA